MYNLSPEHLISSMLREINVSHIFFFTTVDCINSLKRKTLKLTRETDQVNIIPVQSIQSILIFSQTEYFSSLLVVVIKKRSDDGPTFFLVKLVTRKLGPPQLNVSTTEDDDGSQENTKLCKLIVVIDSLAYTNSILKTRSLFLCQRDNRKMCFWS